MAFLKLKPLAVVCPQQAPCPDLYTFFHPEPHLRSEPYWSLSSTSRRPRSMLEALLSSTLVPPSPWRKMATLSLFRRELRRGTADSQFRQKEFLSWVQV